MIPLIGAAIGGCLATALAMAPFGPVTAMLAGSFGGSLCAAIAALHIAGRGDRCWRIPTDVDLRADAWTARIDR